MDPLVTSCAAALVLLMCWLLLVVCVERGWAAALVGMVVVPMEMTCLVVDPVEVTCLVVPGMENTCLLLPGLERTCPLLPGVERT